MEAVSNGGKVLGCVTWGPRYNNHCIDGRYEKVKLYGTGFGPLLTDPPDWYSLVFLAQQKAAIQVWATRDG